MPYRKLRVLLVLVIAFVSLVTFTLPIHAVEAYNASANPSYSQEINSGTTLQLSVTNASTFTTYTFTWRVTDPTGTTTTASRSTGTFFSTVFTQTVVFPRDFSAGAVTNYVGNYTVHVDQTAPNPAKTNVASTQFEIGLSTSKTLKRTYQATLKAQGYTAADNVTVDVKHNGSSLPGFPTFTLANSTGLVIFSWRPPSSTPLGASVLTFRGSGTLKVPSDTQTITILPANMTVSSLTLIPGILQRTQSVEVRFSASYLSGISVQNGSAAVRIVESDAITTHYIVASYNSSLGLFRGTYRTSPSGLTGTWTVFVDRNSTDDGYGDVGPSSPVSTQLAVQQAVLSISVSPLNQQYENDQVIGLFVSITNPDGSLFGSGTVTATIASNNNQIGSPTSLNFDPSIGWVGSYKIGAKDPLGTWTVSVTASDAYGNHGQATVSTTVTSATTLPPQQPEVPLLSLPLFIFLLSIGISGGIGGILLWRNRFAPVPQGLPFETLFQLLGGEIPARSTVLILGTDGDDATGLAFQLVSRTLDKGDSCALLAYETAPSELASTMKKYGWKPGFYIEKGILTEVDCYSRDGTLGAAKNPLDFGEVGVLVGNMMEKKHQGTGPTVVFIDSLTDILKTNPPRKVFGFLSLLAEKVKNEKGVLLVPVERAAVPQELVGVLDSLADGIIELDTTASGRKTLTVRKTFGRQVKPPLIEYDVRRGRGLLFKRERK